MQAIKTCAEFMTAVESYYGNYDSEFKKEIVFKYVSKNFNREELDELFTKLRQSYTSQYKTPPDEYAFHNISNLSPESRAEEAWAELIRYNTGHSILCTDPAVQETIKSMGGWDTFCEYRAKENHWARKDFIERYRNLMSPSMNVEPEILKGFSAKYYRRQINLSDVKLVGNKDNGQYLIDQAMAKQIDNNMGMEALQDIIKLPQEATE